jgi:hypothetical protein
MTFDTKLAKRNSDAALLLQRICLFGLPFILLFFINLIIDPYNSNRYINLPFDKKQIAMHFNERLWKLQTFHNHPTKYIIIGDSRAQRIDQTTVSKLTDHNYTNLSLSGATLVEIIDTFWFATEQTILEKVYFCLNFDRFNDWQTASGTHQTIELIKHPLALYVRPEITKASFYILKNYFKPQILTQAPPMDKDNFWQQQLNEADGRFRKFVEPLYVTRQLKQVADYCKDHAIDLHFVILPTHQSLQERIAIAHLDEHYTKFKQLLSTLGTTHDLDIKDDFTQEKKYFSDPWHCTHYAGDLITKRVWNNRST